MKKGWLLIVLSACVFLTSCNFYSPEFNLVVCDTECLHENGHKLDHSLGDISKSESFQTAVKVYLAILWNYPAYRDEFSKNFIGYAGITAPYLDDTRFISVFSGREWGGYSELYADIYKWSGGNIEEIPTSLRKFYERK
jgi:hypothetical protein